MGIAYALNSAETDQHTEVRKDGMGPPFFTEMKLAMAGLLDAVAQQTLRVSGSVLLS